MKINKLSFFHFNPVTIDQKWNGPKNGFLHSIIPGKTSHLCYQKKRFFVCLPSSQSSDLFESFKKSLSNKACAYQILKELPSIKREEVLQKSLNISETSDLLAKLYFSSSSESKCPFEDILFNNVSTRVFLIQYAINHRIGFPKEISTSISGPILINMIDENSKLEKLLLKHALQKDCHQLLRKLNYNGVLKDILSNPNIFGYVLGMKLRNELEQFDEGQQFLKKFGFE